MLTAIPGGQFILDEPDEIPAIWGAGTQVLMAEGEALLIVASPGVGKTTIAGQLVLRRAGIPGLDGDDLLGLPVKPDHDRRVLYIAADRPRQIARSFRRMVRDEHRRHLDEGVMFWRGPLPFDVVEEPQRLVAFAQNHGAGTIVIDGLSDIASPLSEDRVGGRVKMAIAHAVAAGIEVVALYHPRKATNDGRKPRSLDDVYGSTWITAGVGSVVFLYGEAGDLAVELLHLKQPADIVGPLELIHDHDTGTTRVVDQASVFDIVQRATSGGVSAKDVAVRVTGKIDPSRNEVEKARRKLDRLVREDKAVKVDPEDPRSSPVLYRPRAHREPPVNVHVHPSRDVHAVHDLAQEQCTEGSRIPDSAAPPLGGEPRVHLERAPDEATADEEARALELAARYGGEAA